MVTIAPNSDQNFKKYLNTKEPVDGYSIASIEWSERVGATKVTISKDGKFGTLTFNQALLTTAKPTAALVLDEMRQSMAVAPSPGAGQASRARMRREIQRDTGLNTKAIAAPVPQEVPIQQEQQAMQRPGPRHPRQSGEKDQLPP